MSVIVFPGQGSQFVEMGKDFYDSFQEVKDTFNTISDVSKCVIAEPNHFFGSGAIIFPLSFCNQAPHHEKELFAIIAPEHKDIKHKSTWGRSVFCELPLPSTVE